MVLLWFLMVSPASVQTETVGRQARVALPMVAFVNKLDRVGASLETVEASVAHRLTLMTQRPVFGEGSASDEIVDVIDLVDLEGARARGSEIIDARTELVEKVAGFDDELADLYLCDEDGGAGIGTEELRSALRRVTLSPHSPALVALGGSAMRDFGVRRLMDSLVHYLPSPMERGGVDCVSTKSDKTVSLEPDSSGPLAALAFKVQHDAQRGPVVFFRVYSGTMKAKSVVLNATWKTLRSVSPSPRAECRQSQGDQRGAGEIGAAVG